MNPTVKRIILGSRKYKNLVLNGNFINTDGIIANQATILAVNNIITVTGDGTGANPSFYQDNNNPISGHKYYFYCEFMVTNSDCQRVTCYPSTTLSVVVLQNAPDINTWYKKSVISTDNASYPYFKIFFEYLLAATANGKSGIVKKEVCVDLTLYGIENKSLEWCDANIPQNIIW